MFKDILQSILRTGSVQPKQLESKQDNEQIALYAFAGVVLVIVFIAFIKQIK